MTQAKTCRPCWFSIRCAQPELACAFTRPFSYQCKPAITVQYTHLLHQKQACPVCFKLNCASNTCIPVQWLRCVLPQVASCIVCCVGAQHIGMNVLQNWLHVLCATDIVRHLIEVYRYAIGCITLACFGCQHGGHPEERSMPPERLMTLDSRLMTHDS